MTTGTRRAGPFGRRAFLGALGLAGVTACGPGSVPAATVGTTPAASAYRRIPVGFSLGSPVLWSTETDLVRTMDMVAESGATMVRFGVSWAFAEPFQGYYDWAPSDRVIDAAHGRSLRILATLANSPAWASLDGRRHTGAPADPEQFGEFAGKVAHRYRGKVSDFEVWNEPNGRIFFGPDPDPKRYTSTLVASYAAIKAIQPEATVVGGALGVTDTTDGAIAPVQFLARMYQAGAAGSFDALSYHPYDYNAPLATGALYPTSPMAQMVEMRALMSANGDGRKPFWITEYGAPTSLVSEEEQSTLVIDSIRQWPEVSAAGPFFVYSLRDAGEDAGDQLPGFGLTTREFVPKPAFVNLSRLLADGIPERNEYRPFAENTDNSLGASVTPVFAIGDGYGQQYERGTRFKTPSGWLDSPPAVAALARLHQILPAGPFANGYQDFRAPNGGRIFTSERTGTHLVVGSILTAWSPRLGFPITDEYPVDTANGARSVDFEYGRITWAPTTGAQVRFW